MKMGRSLDIALSIIFFIIIFPGLGASQLLGDDCKSLSCRKKGPVIRFPFWLKGCQSHDSGYPLPAAFELSCTDGNETVIELPFAGKFFVDYIDYMSQALYVHPTDSNCLPKRFLHLNFSLSPFTLNRSEYYPDYYPYDYYPDYYPNYYKSYNYTFFNCSSRDAGFYAPITCLSVPGYGVYAFPSEEPMSFVTLSSCIKVKSISIDLKLHEPLPLMWLAPKCRNCEVEGKKCRLKSRNGTETETECLDIPKGSSTKQGSPTKRVIAGVTVGFFLLVVAVGASLYRICNSNKLERENQIKIERFLKDYKALNAIRYSYADIKRITNQFKNKLGQGGYGSVFKGKLSNEILVAVKILNNSTGNGEEFINEVGTMSRIHHVNVVRLVGFCADGFKRALVYEFQPNESLEKFIFSKDVKNPSLGWKKLQDIALGIAKGIEYLHQGCDQRILHFDIKPHNILLDHNFNPKISDFGLAKLCSKEQSAVSMTAARGTMGYIAPEVFSRNFGNVSYKSDVFSFGMMLLEMVGGRKNIDTTVENTSQVYFPEWIYNRLDQGEELVIQVDEEDDAKIAKKLTIVALWCIQWYPVDRPSMKVVVQMLEGALESLIMPPNPFASTDQPTTSATMAVRPFHTELTVISEAE